MRPFTLLLLIVIFFGCSDSSKSKPESYGIGFRTLHGVDKSRLYKPNTDSSDYLHFRPIDLDIWYPAVPSNNDTVLAFRNILGLFDKRANYYTASTAGNGLSQQVAQLFCTGYHCSDTSTLLNFKTNSVKNSIPARGRFPIIVYFSAFNGMSYENYSLFEDLARSGFVVVSISSIGRFPGDMTMKKEDLMEQVNDAVYGMKLLRDDPGIDFTKIGLVGYSWGGLAACAATGKISNIACIISLDGSELHHYGQKDEDADFDDIVRSNVFGQIKMDVPYLRLQSSSANKSPQADSVFDFLARVSGEKQVYQVDSAQHEDFSCLSMIVRRAGHCRDDHRYQTVATLVTAFFEQHLKMTNSFTTSLAKELNKTISKK